MASTAQDVETGASPDPGYDPETGRPAPSAAWVAANAERFTGGGIPDAPVIVTLAEVGRIRYKRGTIRVTVKDAGSGPVVDARFWLDARDGYRTRRGAKPSEPEKPTREGFWLDVAAAEQLMDLLAEGIVAAEGHRGGEAA